MERKKKVLAIRLFDHIFQAGFFDDTAPKTIISKEPLFIAYTQTNILHFQKAFEAEGGFCLMKSEEELEKDLERARKSVVYPVPNALDLWCEMMIRIIEAATKKLAAYDYETSAIVISIPDYLDKSLHKLISLAVDCYRSVYKHDHDVDLPIRVVGNLMSMASFYMREISVSTMHVQDNGRIQIYCFLEFGANMAEWSIVLFYENKSVVLASDYINLGNMYTFDTVRKIVFEGVNTGDKINVEDINRIDTWKSSHRSKYEGIINPIAFMYNTDSPNFKDDNDDNIPINKDDLKKQLSGITEMIVDKILATVTDVEQRLEQMARNNETIKVEEFEIKLQGQEQYLKVIKYFYDTEIRNWVFTASMCERSAEKCGREIPFFDTNGSTQLVISGATYISRMFSDELIGSQSYQNDPSQTFHQESTICEWIEPNRYSLKKVLDMESMEGAAVHFKDVESVINSFADENIMKENAITFPEQPIITFNPIPIGVLPDGGYVLIDNKKKIVIGTVLVRKGTQERVHLVMEQTLSTYRPVRNPKQSTIASKLTTRKKATKKMVKKEVKVDSQLKHNLARIVVVTKGDKSFTTSFQTDVTPVYERGICSRVNPFYAESCKEVTNKFNENAQDIVTLKSDMAGQKRKLIRRDCFPMVGDHIRILESISGNNRDLLAKNWYAFLKEFKEEYGLSGEPAPLFKPDN